MNYIIVGGGTAFRSYVLDVKKQNKQTNVHRKKVSNKNKKGEVVWSKYYYYRKVKRSLEEVEEKMMTVKNPNSNHIFYKDEYIGSEPPVGFKEDELTLIREAGDVVLESKDLLVKDEETIKKLKKIAPSYFNGLTVFKITRS